MTSHEKSLDFSWAPLCGHGSAMTVPSHWDGRTQSAHLMPPAAGHEHHLAPNSASRLRSQMCKTYQHVNLWKRLKKYDLNFKVCVEMSILGKWWWSTNGFWFQRSQDWGPNITRDQIHHQNFLSVCMHPYLYVRLDRILLISLSLCLSYNIIHIICCLSVVQWYEIQFIVQLIDHRLLIDHQLLIFVYKYSIFCYELIIGCWICRQLWLRWFASRRPHQQSWDTWPSPGPSQWSASRCGYNICSNFPPRSQLLGYNML